MADYSADNDISRDDLVRRVELMEAMIAEGRLSTAKYGWLFLMWGLLYIAAVVWMAYLPFAYLAWPVCIAAGIVAGVVSESRRKRAEGRANMKSRSVEAVWKAMAIAITLFAFGAGLSGHFVNPACLAAIMLFLGLAHAASAMILRWRVQGLAAAVWGGCGVASFVFTSSRDLIVLFLVASFFGMVLFGLYAMTLERRRAGTVVERHA